MGQKMPRIPAERVLEEIRRLADELGRSPTAEEFDERGAFSTTPAEKRFGTYRQAVIEAGYEPQSDDQTKIAEESLLIDLIRVAGELGKAPSKYEYNDRGEYNSDTIVRRLPASFDEISDEAYFMSKEVDVEELDATG